MIQRFFEFFFFSTQHVLGIVQFSLQFFADLSKKIKETNDNKQLFLQSTY
jgi:hypothetical protein